MLCSTCNALVLEGATFCNQCGTPVASSARSAAPGAGSLQVERLGEPPAPLEVRPAPFVPGAFPTPTLGTPLPPLPLGPLDAPPAFHAPAVAVAAVRYGGFWRRFWGLLVDGAWGYLLATPIMLLFRIDPSSGGAPGADGFGSTEYWSGFAISQAVGWLYAALFMCSPAQGTLGQLLFNLKVTDVAGRRISFLRATGRYFAQILSTLLLFVGYLMIAFHPQKRGLHDLIAGTLVVHRARESKGVPSR